MGGGDRTVESDPWKNMPDFVKEAYERDIGYREDFLKEADAMRQNADLSPRDVAQMDPAEKQAYENAAAATELGSEYTDKALAALPGELTEFEDVGDLGQLGDVADPAAMADVQDPSSEFKRAAGPQDINEDALRGKYESDYTNDVVGTTLQGMQRQADRERLRRESQAAAIGGTSNTRTAVADAVAQQLTGQNMASTEAQLRDQAFRTAAEYGLQEAEGQRAFNLAKSEFDLAQNEAERGYGLNLAEFGLSEAQAQATNELQRAGFSLEEALAKVEQANKATQFSADQAEAERQYGLDTADVAFRNSEAISNLGQEEYLRNYSLAGLLGNLGETKRGIEQAGYDAQHEAKRAKQDEMTWLASLYTGTNLKGPVPVGGTKTTEGPSTFGQIAGLAAQATGAFIGASDERVKTEVEAPKGSALDKLEKLSSKTYRYKPGHGHTPDRTSGLMAQDVERAGIEGGVREIDGVKHVDFYPVLATVVDAVNELKAQRRPGRGLGKGT